MNVTSFPVLYSSSIVLLLILIVTRGSKAISLTPSPVQFQCSTDIIQCGCKNEKLLVLTPVNGISDQMLTEVVLTGFFSFSGVDNTCILNGSPLSKITSYLIPAAIIALDDINNSSDILQGYHLTLDIRDSKCDHIHAITELVKSVTDGLYFSSLNLGIISPGCGLVTEAVAGVVSKGVNLPIVSYGFNSPRMQQESKQFSTLFSISQSLLLTMRSAIKLLKYFNWVTNVAFITEENDIFLSTTENVLSSNNNIMTLSDGNISILVKEHVKISFKSASFKSFLRSIREKYIRVILGLLSQRLAAQLICTARSGVIPGNGFVFVLVGTYSENWWQTETTYCSLTDDDVNSVIVVSGVSNPDVNAILQSGRSVQNFKEEYNQKLNAWCNNSLHWSAIDPFSHSVYDAVWSLALALNDSIDAIDWAIDHGLYYDPDTLGTIVNSLQLVNFSGLTGQVRFTNNERIGTDSIQQIQDGTQVTIGYFEGKRFVIKANNYFIWPGNTTPSDMVTKDLRHIDLHLLIIVSILTSLGMIFNLVMCIFNTYYRKHKILRASSQRLNYVILVGVFFAYTSEIIHIVRNSSLDSVVSEGFYKAMCMFRIWMLSLSFTFTYGILFVRTWRIYRVFDNPWGSSRPYKDYHLLLIAGVFVIGDVFFLVPWTIIDPRCRSPFETGISYVSFTRIVYNECSSVNNQFWMGIVSAYKVIVIVAGIILISLVKKTVINRKIFDDSRSLIAAVYISGLSFIIGLLLILLFQIGRQKVLAFLANAGWVNLSSSGTLICVFLPKVYRIMIKKDTISITRCAENRS